VSLRPRTIRRVLGVLLGLALLVLGLRLWAVDVLRVVEQSMWPSLHGGSDRVLLERWRRTPERFEIWAFSGETGAGLFVKRVLALPGEAIALRGGDLWLRAADGTESRVQRTPELVAQMSVRQPGPRACDPARWVLLKGEMSALGGESLEWRGPQGFEAVLRGCIAADVLSVMDDFVGNEGLTHPGKHVVSDTSLDVRCFPVNGRVELVHAIQGDSRGVVIEGDRLSTLDGRPLGRVPAAGQALRISTLDGEFSVVTTESSGERELVHENRNTLPGAGLSQWIVRGSGQAHMQLLDLRRDVHYVFDGAMSAIASYQVAAEACFVAGDNQSVSIDSRTLGPVPLARMQGCVTRILWPRARAGRLD